MAIFWNLWFFFFNFSLIHSLSKPNREKAYLQSNRRIICTLKLISMPFFGRFTCSIESGPFTVLHWWCSTLKVPDNRRPTDQRPDPTVWSLISCWALQCSLHTVWNTGKVTWQGEDVSEIALVIRKIRLLLEALRNSVKRVSSKCRSTIESIIMRIVEIPTKYPHLNQSPPVN